VVFQRPKLLESKKPTAILSGQTIRISTGRFNYEAEKMEWVAAVSPTSKNTKRPRSPMKKIEGVTKISLFAQSGDSWTTLAEPYPDFSARRHSPFPGA
jgi:hypothetical protein